MNQQERQDVFDRVANHLLAQKVQSTKSFTQTTDFVTHKEEVTAIRYMYRGSNGLKCAIGALIDDEHYNSEMETCRANEPLVLAALSASGLAIGPEDDDIDFLLSLQNLHDGYGLTSESWEQRLTRFAKLWNLNFNNA